MSWFEAAQFVNWLNTSTGHHVAYNFLPDGTFTTWSAPDAAGTSLFRHKDAFYFLPTEDEWVKAAYWNGANLQEYATKAGESLTQTGWNYYLTNSPLNRNDPWDVGLGSEELNGTHNMMGNVWEWAENPYYFDLSYPQDSYRAQRGAAYNSQLLYAQSSAHGLAFPTYEYYGLGFRVASVAAAVPEPGSLAIWACGGLGVLLLRRRRRK